MALGHRYVCVYPTSATTTPTTSTASQGDPGTDYSAVYTSMAACESAENGDYTTGGAKDIGSGGDGTILHIEIIDPDGDSDWSGNKDEGHVPFDGWSLDKAGDGSYVEVKTYGTARSATGLWDTTAYIMTHDSDTAATLHLDNDSSASDFLDITFDGVQLEHTTETFYVVRFRAGGYHNDLQFLNCYFYQATSDNNISVSNSTGTPTRRFKNCIMQGGTHGIYVPGAGTKIHGRPIVGKSKCERSRPRKAAFGAGDSCTSAFS